MSEAKETEIKETEIMEAPYYFIGEYLYTYGEISKFFKEVKENKRLFATKCSQCGKVWMPPRKHCSECYSPANWIPLSGRGTVLSYTYCWYAAGTSQEMPALVDLPYNLAAIQLDGADTCLLHTVVTSDRRLGAVKVGMRVKVVWRDNREGKVTDFYFVPEES